MQLKLLTQIVKRLPLFMTDSSLRRESPNILQDDEFEFAQGVVPQLHEILADEAFSKARASKKYHSAFQNLTRVPGRSLWEKMPELPTTVTINI